MRVTHGYHLSTPLLILPCLLTSWPVSILYRQVGLTQNNPLYVLVGSDKSTLTAIRHIHVRIQIIVSVSLCDAQYTTAVSTTS